MQTQNMNLKPGTLVSYARGENPETFSRIEAIIITANSRAYRVAGENDDISANEIGQAYRPIGKARRVKVRTAPRKAAAPRKTLTANVLATAAKKAVTKTKATKSKKTAEF